MATSLINTTPQATYTSLLKLGDNSALSASLKRISDGAGNDTPIEISTAAVQFGGSTGMYWDNTNRRLGIGTNAPGVPLHLTTSASEPLIRLVRQSVTTEISSGSGGNASIGTTSSAPFAFITNNSTRAQIAATGEFGIGAASLTSARLHVRGSGATSATTALLVENSAGTQSLRVRDDGQVALGQSTNFTVDANITYNRYELVVGALSSVPSAILSATSTTRGFLPPRMTTTQKNAIASPAAGLVVYDTDTNKLCCYNGTTWNDLF